MTVAILLVLVFVAVCHCGSYANIAPHKANLLKDAGFTLDSIGLARNWIEFGYPRTATTVQFMALNAFGWVLCGFENVEVGLAIADWHLTPMGKAVEDGKCLSITKTHKLFIINELQKTPGKFTFFATNSSKSSAKVPHVIPWKYVQQYDDLMEHGLRKQLQAYGKIFHINRASANVVESIENWLELWDITRICCGAQMSKTWRSHLHDLNGKSLSKMPQGVHLCQTHDYLALEKNMTQIEAQLFGSVLTRVGSCQCSITKTINLKLPFNHKLYQNCTGPLDKLIARIQ